MSKQSKKPSFLGGAAVLAAAVAIVKVIGAVYKIPFGNIVGSQGQTYFNVAYNIYNVLLTISTAGLPLAISKLTSQAHAQGRENQKRKIFRTAIWLFFVLGLAGSALSARRSWPSSFMSLWASGPSVPWHRRCSVCACWPVCGATPRARAI